MATGVLAVSALGDAGGPMSSNLSGSTTPLPTPRKLELMPGTTKAAALAYSAPVIVATSVAGARGAMHDGQWLDRIHVLPRSVALGTLPGDRSVQVEVWNAYRDGLTLDHTALTGPAGVTLGVTLPKEYPALHSELQSVNVSGSGASSIANVLSWVFKRWGSALTTLGADLTLTGIRVVNFLFAPNGATPPQEQYGYLTDVITAWDGTEQRVQLRENPTQELRFNVTLTSATRILDVMSRIFANGFATYLVPFWPDAVAPGADVLAGATTITVDTVGRGFTIGGSAVLYRDSQTTEAVAIGGMTSTTLSLASPVGSNWPKVGTVIIPQLTMRLGDAPTLQRSAGYVADLEVNFSREAA
jgi:hypothetical protein